MGLLTTPTITPDRMSEIWGDDPVPSSKEGYETLAKNLLLEVKSDTVVFTRKPSSARVTTMASGAK